MGQVKLRYMLEQFVLSWSSCLNLTFKLGARKNLFARINQQVTNVCNVCIPFQTWLVKRQNDVQLFSNSDLFENNVFYESEKLCFCAPLQGAAAQLNRKQWPCNEIKGESTSHVTLHQGTSETTREAASQNLRMFDFTDYFKMMPSHVKNPDFSFLIWFVGFVEGDGSFWYRNDLSAESCNVKKSFCDLKKAESPLHVEHAQHVDCDKCTTDELLLKGKQSAKNKGRCDFEITQAISNVKLLFLIKKTLGFGRIMIYERNGFQYARWYTSKREHILKLVSLLNGNLILEKRQSHFQQWVSNINKNWKLTVEVKPRCLDLSFENAWLSGFCDADAGFYTNVNKNFQRGKRADGSNYYTFFCKFYITQDGEMDFLKKIQNLVYDTTSVSTLTNNVSSKKYNRLEVTRTECLLRLVNYFNKFPLKGSRKIDYLRWVRVLRYKQENLCLTEKSAEKLAKLVCALTLHD
jgi:hypothetical protein